MENIQPVLDLLPTIETLLTINPDTWFMSEIIGKELSVLPEGARTLKRNPAVREAYAFSTSRRPDNPENIAKSIDQLEHLLDSGQKLRRDVPRGYYLNVRV